MNIRSTYLASKEHDTDANYIGRSYYCFCIESALIALQQARALVKGDVIESNHELPEIERLLTEALEAS